MTQELTQLREALRRVKYEAVSLADAQVIALEALTAAQPAQAGRDAFESVLIDGVAYDVQAPVAAELLRLHIELQALPTQPAAQATRIWINHDLRDVSVREQDEPGWVEFEVQTGSIAAQATPEPVGEPDTVPLDALHAAERERDYWKTRARAMLDHAEGTCWYWMGDGEDHLESLVSSLPVVIRADQLRELLAHPAPGVPEGFALVPVKPTPEMIQCAEMWDDGFEGAYARALAAAQAKGGEHA